jgi:hypothetical protein
MKQYILLVKRFFLFLIIVAFTSCASTRTSRYGRTTSFYPDVVKFELTASDFENIGEMDISVKYSRYFAFIRIFELINDKDVSKRNVNTMSMYGKRNIPLSPVMYRALYDVYATYPDADFVIPSYVIEEQENLFLGKKITKTARIKVYKLKI